TQTFTTRTEENVMPTEFRFDDLDLREEPATPAREKEIYYNGASPVHGAPIPTTTKACCV
ncbi:MAG: hypothetical protein QOI11_3450, partial [Candidatus Eremiobacteraeota bacterium]|nr:hypothetical protein [Candidatus Eremiobacteraeota bacterium]